MSRRPRSLGRPGRPGRQAYSSRQDPDRGARVRWFLPRQRLGRDPGPRPIKGRAPPRARVRSEIRRVRWLRRSCRDARVSSPQRRRRLTRGLNRRRRLRPPAMLCGARARLAMRGAGLRKLGPGQTSKREIAAGRARLLVFRAQPVRLGSPTMVVSGVRTSRGCRRPTRIRLSGTSSRPSQTLRRGSGAVTVLRPLVTGAAILGRRRLLPRWHRRRRRPRPRVRAPREEQRAVP